jgi:hypothetical protein
MHDLTCSSENLFRLASSPLPEFQDFASAPCALPEAAWHCDTQVPYVLAQATVFVPIAYWMIRFRATASAFFFFYFVFFLCAPIETASAPSATVSPDSRVDREQCPEQSAA